MGIEARCIEITAIWKKGESVSCSIVSDFATPWTSLPGSSIHGILQAGILEWVAISFSWGSSWSHPGIEPHSPALQADVWATREAIV